MKGKYFFIISFVLLLCSFKGDGLIETVYPDLLGDYEFYKSVADRSVSFAKDDTNQFTIVINKKDQIIFSKNGKKERKMKFSRTKMPFLDDPNHILFGINNSYEPLFYKADTIVVQSYPIEYQDNYFIKKKS
ncbi:hypothetical protein [Fluviicola taffensis]|uniref:Uncharacterized protein n=1 Tax=Fluviicola taffensis (strain DSM 16823 / NCIMB 13979 / RW262) TaxID=755732 RepID=F2IHZ7_FLUTR|nr:hypothetical protein [Fluviicola taffensis]AEA42697.1 hypothetical protein Fluta_0693 [Fluviicola taffensis DSM 16823]